MAEELDLPFGPWSLLVSGTWGNYPYNVYFNPDRTLLVIVYDKTGDNVSGLLVAMKQPLAVEGDLSKFILAQKREMIYHEKFAGGTRYAYLFVGSSNAYIPFNSQDLMGEVKKQYQELGSLTKMAKELVEGYGAKAKPLGEAGDEWVQALLGDPFTVFTLSKPLGPMREEAFAKSKVGVGLDGAEVNVRLESLAKALVVGGTAKDRLHTLQVLAEAAVLANAPVMVFDSTGVFEGLAYTNNQTDAFKDYGMTPMPVSFQFKSFELGKNLFVDLSQLTVMQFLEAFGLGNADVALLFKKVYEARKAGFASLEDLAAELGRLPESRDAPQYLISKSVRMVRLIQRTSSGVFGKQLTPDLIRPWQDAIGRVYYVNLRNMRPQVSNLILSSLLGSMVPAPSKRTSALLVFSQDGRELAPYSKQLQRLEGTGIGRAMQTEHEMDVSFFLPPTLRMELVAPQQVVLTEQGEKKARVKIRPAFTRCTEETPSAPTPASASPAGTASAGLKPLPMARPGA